MYTQSRVLNNYTYIFDICINIGELTSYLLQPYVYNFIFTIVITKAIPSKSQNPINTNFLLTGEMCFYLRLHHYTLNFIFFSAFADLKENSNKEMEEYALPISFNWSGLTFIGTFVLHRG